MTNSEIKDLCNKLAECIINADVNGHEQFYAINKVEQMIKKLERKK